MRALILASAVVAVLLAARPLTQGTAAAYTVYLADGKHALPFRTSGSVELVGLEPVATLFGLTIAEDTLVGGLTVRGKGQTILLIPGQSFASIGPGRVVSLPGPVQRDRGAWQVPIEFLQKAVGPALNLKIDIRKPARVVLVGDVRLPQITGRFDRQGPNGRLVFDIEPSTPHRVTRQGNRLTIRFDAVALDMTPVSGLVPEFVSGVHADGTSILVDLGPSTTSYRADDIDPTHLDITLQAPAPPPPPPPPPTPAAAPNAAPASPAAPARGQVPEASAPPRPIIDPSAGTLRTVVLDPGHGGDDAGVKGVAGTIEKDYVLQFARRLKSAIEGRIGLRVLLTRDADDNTPVDKRTALANNNKADLFISLHANGSVRPTVGGVQVLSLRLDDYKGRTDVPQNTEAPVPVVGGGTRLIDVLPWDLAQIGFTEASATIATLLEQHLDDAHVPCLTRPAAQLPLRSLVGANMPAIMVELGFLSNPGDEQALTSAERPQAIIDAILATLGDIRRGVPASPAGAAR
jgi:N-acetylmuramoyl-L-alanine amidase